MKKVFLTLALVAVSMAANAQWILGGQLGFNTNGGTYTQEDASPVWDMPNNKAMGLTVAPTISYVLNDKMQVGLTLEYNYGTATNYNAAVYANYEEWSKTTATMFTVAPYFRYYFANAGKFNFFCEAALGFGISPRAKIHDYSNAILGYDNEYDGTTKTTQLGLTITPGVNYRISDHWSADCYIDLAGLAFLHNSTKTYVGGIGSSKDDLVSTDVNNYFGLMCNASAQDLNAHLGNFRIGFNYHF